MKDLEGFFFKERKFVNFVILYNYLIYFKIMVNLIFKVYVVLQENFQRCGFVISGYCVFILFVFLLKYKKGLRCGNEVMIFI